MKKKIYIYIQNKTSNEQNKTIEQNVSVVFHEANGGGGGHFSGRLAILDSKNRHDDRSRSCVDASETRI